MQMVTLPSRLSISRTGNALGLDERSPTDLNEEWKMKNEK